MYTLYNLPKFGVLNIYATAGVITNESVEHGDYDRRGWVNTLDGTDIYESRNDVNPVFTTKVSEWHGDINAHKETIEEIDRIISWHGATESYDGSTIYFVDGVTHDYATDEIWCYALHASVKHYDPEQGYIESEIDITTRN